MVTKKPNKQRKALYNAPLHKRQKLVAAHLSKTLRKQIGKRSMPLRTGDEVTVMRGSFAGTSGKVSEVDIKKRIAFVESVKRKKVSGKEVNVPLQPSNLMITNLNLDDPRRKDIISRAKKEEKK